MPSCPSTSGLLALPPLTVGKLCRSLLLWFSAVGVLAGAARGQAIEGSDALVIESARVSAEVLGRLAVTTFEIDISNTDTRAAQGVFVYPLSRSQAVTGFALDFDGVMRDAVPLENPPPRVAYDEKAPLAEALLDERVHPAVFRLPLPPLAPGGLRKLRFSIEEQLGTGGDSLLYRLALDFPRRLKELHLAFNVHGAGARPPELRTSLDLPLPPWTDSQFLEIERANFDARGSIELVLPRSDDVTVVTGRFDGKEYFCAELPSSPIVFSRPAPKIVGLIWDFSASQRTRDRDKEFALLDAWFAELKQVEVRLVSLRDHAGESSNFTIKDGNWSALRRELESTPYDGATSVAGLKDDPRVDAWVLFSDARFTFGVSNTPADVSLHGPVHTVSSNPDANWDWLRSVSTLHDGETVNLSAMDPARAAYALQTHSVRVLKIEGNGGAVELFPEPGSAVTGDTVRVGGIIQKPDTIVRLLLGNNPGNAQSVEIPILSGNDPSELAPRLWAEARLHQAAIAPGGEPAETARLRLARQFRILLPNTSLVLLDSVDDYLRHGVEPPVSLRAAWNSRREAAERSAAADHEQHRQYLLGVFQQRVAWWENKADPRVSQPTPTLALRPGADAAPKNQLVTVRPKGSGMSAADGAAPPEGPAVGQPGYESAERLTGTGAAPEDPAARFADASIGTRVVTSPTLAYDVPGAASRDEVPDAFLSPWSRDDTWLEHLRQSPADSQYDLYLKERSQHLREPGFYLAAAEAFFAAGNSELGLRILSNLAEFGVDDADLYRLLASRLLELGRPGLALPFFQRVRDLRPDEPQSWRDLALALLDSGEPQQAVNLLWKIADRSWDARYPEVELIALSELNAIVATCGRKLDLGAIDPRLLHNLPMDLRVVLTWDAEDADLDLWVTDPGRETARYDAPQTSLGGRISRDFTGGFGPEEFDLPRARPGNYAIQLNFNGDRRTHALGPITARVKVITDFGLPQQKEKHYSLRLPEQQEVIPVGTIEVAAKRKR